MYVEINDPKYCTIVAQPPGTKLAPSEGNARTCPQCQQLTWINTSTCMWCGHDTMRAKLLWIAAGAAVAVLGLLARIAVKAW